MYFKPIVINKTRYSLILLLYLNFILVDVTQFHQFHSSYLLNSVIIKNTLIAEQYIQDIVEPH